MDGAVQGGPEPLFHPARFQKILLHLPDENSIPYVNIAQASPGLMNRRKRRIIKALLKKSERGVSAWFLSNGPPQEVIQKMVSLHIFPEDVFENKHCSICESKGKTSELRGDNGTSGDGLGLRCKVCGYRSPVYQLLPDGDKHFWLERVSMRKQLSALWYFTQVYSANDATDILCLDANASVRFLYDNFMNMVARHQQHENECFQCGGEGIDIHRCIEHTPPHRPPHRLVSMCQAPK